MAELFASLQFSPNLSSIMERSHSVLNVWRLHDLPPVSTSSKVFFIFPTWKNFYTGPNSAVNILEVNKESSGLAVTTAMSDGKSRGCRDKVQENTMIP